MDHQGDTDQLLARAARGDQASWNVLITTYRQRLWRMAAARLDPRLQGRIDPSDVVQEACLEASTRFEEFLRNRSMPFFLWLRLLTGQRLALVHRQHLGTRMRTAAREVPFDRAAVPEASSAVLAAKLAANDPSASDAAMRVERLQRLEQCLERLNPGDREILALRHAEQLSRAEIAQALGINEAAASKRYLRALKRLKELLAQIPGALEELAI